jgi:hypothetical protein
MAVSSSAIMNSKLSLCHDHAGTTGALQTTEPVTVLI